MAWRFCAPQVARLVEVRSSRSSRPASSLMAPLGRGRIAVTFRKSQKHHSFRSIVVSVPITQQAFVQLASRIAGVRALYDEIEVGLPRDTWNATKDAWITARLRSEFMLDADIRSGNYTIETENGSVFLIGSARSQAELDRATRIARYIPGVQRVVSYVELRPGTPVAEQPVQPAATTGAAL